MKGMSRYWAVSVVVLSIAAALASAALARGGGRGGGRGGAGTGNLCLSGTLLDLSVSRIDALLKATGSQKTALEDLKKAARDYSETMTRACAGDAPMDIPAKLTASDKRLEAALTGVRKLKPAVEKFYAALNDDQKSEASLFIDVPGL